LNFEEYMTEQFQSPTFLQPKDQLRSSITESILEKPQETSTYRPQRSLQGKDSHQASQTSLKYADNLGIHDLGQRSVEIRSQKHTERSNKPPRMEDYYDDHLTKHTLDMQSPSSNIQQTRSGYYSPYTTAPTGRNPHEYEPENIKNYSTINSYEPQNANSVFARLETEILNLKRKLDKLDKPTEPEKEIKKPRNRSKLKELNKTFSDEEESDFKMESKKAKTKGKEALPKETKTLKPAHSRSTKHFSKERPEHEKTFRIDRSEITKDEKRTGRTASKLRGETKRTQVPVEEKYENLKDKYKELRGVCREYVEKAEDLEAILKSKDDQLENYEQEIRRKHEALLERGEVISDLKKQIANREERIDKIQKESDEKIRQQEERGDKYKELAREKDREYKAEKAELMEEIRRLREEVEQGNLREVNLNQRNASFQEEINALKIDLNSKSLLLEELAKIEDSRGQEILELKSEVRKLRNDNEELTDNNRDLEQAKRDIEERSGREKRLYEEHLASLEEERNRETLKQKEKLESLKDELKKAWGNSDKYKEEKEKLEITLERGERQRNNLEEELTRYKEKLRQSEKDK